MIWQARKSNVRLQAVDEKGEPLRNTTISMKMNRLAFPFGSAMSKEILQNSAYQNWFASRFTVATFANEMKWYTNEYAQGKDNYYEADAMLNFANTHNIQVRGHNVLWDDPNYQPSWVPQLSPQQLQQAVQRRVNSVVERYKGKLIAWDVVNENLHFSFFENKLGKYYFAKIFNDVHKIDGEATLFLNEYNTIEDQRDTSSAPSKYIQKIREIRRLNNNLPLGIGLESHFPNTPPNLPYMRASLDTLVATGLPVWITEIDVADQPNQVKSIKL